MRYETADEEALGEQESPSRFCGNIFKLRMWITKHMRKAQNCKIEHRVGLYDFEVTHSIFEINLFHRLSFGILESHGEPLPMSSMGKRKV